MSDDEQLRRTAALQEEEILQERKGRVVFRWVLISVLVAFVAFVVWSIKSGYATWN